MRKVIVLLILTLSLMIGCNDNKNLGNEYIEGKDAQYMFMGSQDKNYIAMAENGYYFLNGIYIYYCDFDTMQSVVLCNKPNCLHDKELDETKKYNCNGFVLSVDLCEFLTVYDGYLYCYISEDFVKATDPSKSIPELIKISLDGSERSTICTLEKSIRTMTLHRGKLYYVVENIIDEDNGIVNVTLKELDIFNKNTEPKEIVSLEGISANINNVIPKGNNIIYTKAYLDKDYNTIYSSEVYNLENKSINCIGKDVTEDDLGITSISDNNIIFIPRKIENGEVVLDDNIYSYNLDTNKSEILFKREFEDIIFYSDDKYIYSDNILQKFKSESSTETFRRILNIYDKEGDKVDCIDVSELSDDFAYFLSGDDKYMVIKAENEEGAYIKYIDKSKIGTGNAKLETLFELESKYLDTGVRMIVE